MATICVKQLNYGLYDIAANYSKVLSEYRKCESSHVDLVVFGRYAISGYLSKEPVLAGEFVERSHHCVQDLASSASGTHAIVGGVSERNGMLTEAIYLLSRGKSEKIMEIPAFTHSAPSGYVVFDVGSLRVAMILEGCTLEQGTKTWVDVYGGVPDDIDVVILLGRSQNGYSGLFRSSNMEDVLKKHGSFIYLNMLGGYESGIFPGGSLIYSNMSTDAFSMWEEDTKVLELQASAGKSSPSVPADYTTDTETWNNGSSECSGGNSKTSSSRQDQCSVPIVEPNKDACSGASVALSHFGHEEFVYRTIMLAVRDYVKKSGFRGVVLGLSGGIDSALVAAISADALSPECVYTYMLPTRYTSQCSIDDAKQCAGLLGVSHEVVSIEAIFGACSESVTVPAGTSSIDGCVTNENMQSRIRGMYLMAVSNSMGLILLATGNKSEICAGYMTLYGDSCGGFAPIKDVYKTKVYDLVRWRNSNVPVHSLCAKSNVIPKSILEKAPSAELKPNQTDQDTLPEYHKLDAILNLLIDKRLPEKEVVRLGYDEEEVKLVAGLVRKSAFKLNQAAPGPILAGIL
ncbi:NAD(+) synthase [Candidatus Anaplasma sp. TIGMIC]|uniref:NAD(+) synthase n=1 Tax=Candidatus Anaplasma sp. TIGMIC TaxID=3020713 RepID=UPI00232C864D|nr:NAD(+) synthase [Candidatus Anaplasma sp. TIGMIC]MDB1135094.1 NAD(+) synthase [Candidatus Anaplasma sp. TIGMIC]